MSTRSPYRPTLILAGLLIALGIYLVSVEFPRERKSRQAEETADRLFVFDGKEALGLLIRTLSDPIQLEKSENGTWRLIRPIESDADPREVHGYLNTLSDIRFDRVIEEPVAHPAEFGLARPTLDITVRLPDRSERLLIGDEGPLPNTLFVERESNQKVVLTQAWIKAALSKTVFDFRTKIVLPVDHTLINLVRLEFPKTRIQLTKQGEHWELKEPVEAGADDEAVKALLLAIENLRANFFIDPGEEFEQIKGRFKRPIIAITLRQGQEERRIFFYDSPESPYVYAVTEPTNPIVRMGRSVLDSFQSKTFNYKNKALILLDNDIYKIEVKTPQEKYVLARKDSEWRLEGESPPIAQDRVHRPIEQIKNLKAHQAPDAPIRGLGSVGLKPPLYEIRLGDLSDHTLASLQLGNELKGMLYARGNTPLDTVLINKDFLDEIPHKNELTIKENTQEKNAG